MNQQKIEQQIEAIRLYKQLIADSPSLQDIPLCEAEKRILSEFQGWGTFSFLLNKNVDPKWAGYAQELRELLTEEEWREAEIATPNAFYTSPEVIKAIWQGILRLGVTGEILALEPGCGIGRFMAHAPEELTIKWVGVEREPISNGIAKLLYPDASIYGACPKTRGFEKFSSSSSFDLVIGNVPFGDYGVADPNFDYLNLAIHNYFIAKSLSLLRPAGIMCLITSTGTLNNKTFCEYLADRAQFIGAFRLPGGAFKDEGTMVTSDVILFQRRVSDKEETRKDWIGSAKPKDAILKDGKINLISQLPKSSIPWNVETDWKNFLNKHGIYHQFDAKLPFVFLKDPGLMLGKATIDTLYAGDRAALSPDGRDLTEAIAGCFNQFGRWFIPAPRKLQLQMLPEELQDIPIDSFFELEGVLYCRESSYSTIEVMENVELIRSAIKLHEILEELLMEQQSNTTESRLQSYRNLLNAHYDCFVKQYGCINSKSVERILSQDYRYWLLTALEEEEPETKKFRKTEIFRKRTASPYFLPESCEFARDALIHSLNIHGKVNWNLITDLLDRTEEEAIEELVADDLIYFDPELGEWVLREEYLSGTNVREKLAAAKEAGLERNVKALEPIQPKFLLPPASLEIRMHVAQELNPELCDTRVDGTFRIRLGAHWVPHSIIEEFAVSLLGKGIEAYYFKYPLSHWEVACTDNNTRKGTRNTNTWGTNRAPGHKILEWALNLTSPQVVDVKYDENGKKYEEVNVDETLLAVRIRNDMVDEFEEWLWKDKERSLLLTKLYNQKFNSTVHRKYDGSFLKLPGCHTPPGFKWRKYQLDMIWRGIVDPSFLMAHVVGAGKTAEAIATIMECRRMGLVKKPLVAVLNSTILQIVTEWRRLYPTAKLMVADADNFTKKTLPRFCARAATTDVDAIILGHSKYGKGITLSKESVDRIQRYEISVIEDYQEKIKKKKCLSSKRIGSTRRRLENRQSDMALRLRKNKNSVLTMEQMGVDLLIIDESHFFKNVPLDTKTKGVAGIPTGSSSDRAYDNLMKCSYLHHRKGKIGFLSGTPISNSVAEAWIMLKLLAPDLLAEWDIRHFDEFLATFCEVSEKQEVTVTGYKVKKRCRKIFNLPEFMKLWRMVADVQTAETIGNLAPKVNYVEVDCPSSPAQIAYMKMLFKRAEAIEKGNPRFLINKEGEETKDNMVWIYGDGRAAIAIDARLRYAEAENFLDGKLNTICLHTFRAWELSREVKACQVIFCDASAPSKHGLFSSPVYCRDVLIALGMPPEQIALIWDYKTDEQRKQLFADCNSGKIAVVFGSTEKLGTGTNFQRRLIAERDVDCPWRPTDLNQRQGRIERYGNEFSEVMVFRYVTKGKGQFPGWDAYIYALILKKLEFFKQLMSANLDVREVQDIDKFQMSAKELAALANEDERYQRKFDLELQIQNLQSKQYRSNQQWFDANAKIGFYQRELAEKTKELEQLISDLKRLEMETSDLEMKIGNKLYSDVETFAEDLVERYKVVRKEYREADEAKSPSRQGEAGFRYVGKWAFLEIGFWFQGKNSEMYVVGDYTQQYTIHSTGDMFSDLIGRFNLTAMRKKVEKLIEFRQNSITNANEELARLDKNVPPPPYQEEIAELKAEYKALEKELSEIVVDTDTEPETEEEEEVRDIFDEMWEIDSQEAAPYNGVEPEIIAGLKEILAQETFEWEAKMTEIVKEAIPRLAPRYVDIDDDFLE